MMRMRLRAVAWAIALGVASAGSAIRAQDTVDDQSPRAWLIELNAPVQTFRAEAKAAGLAFTERFVFTRLWRGVSVQASAQAASHIGRLPSVAAVFPVLPVDLVPVDPGTPELIHALSLTGADAAQSSGLSGAGIRVGVMDTGIDYHHPDLGGAFGPGQRVVTGWDFVGDRFDAAASGGALIPHPDADPDDCEGHGTHVAGIIGASGNPAAGGARGVAPGVTFGAYRVFGCSGSTSTDIMIAAMERALDDGMHILNISIGSAFQTWPQYPTTVAADALVDAGVVVVTSIGNSGASGIYSASAPGVGRKVIGVASFDNSHLPMRYFDAAPDGRSFGYLEAAGAPPSPVSGTQPLVRTGTTTATADGCSAAGVSPFPAGSLAGHVALIRRGTCTFYEKSRNAELAGAVGVVLYNNAAGFISPTVAPPAGSPPVTIPVVSILAADGENLSGRLPSAITSSVDITWTSGFKIFPNPTSGTSSSFTSWGLDAELQLKPNVGAPGGLIRSTYPLELGGYAIASGTSMASPHVAGGAALLLEARPGTSPADVKVALQNSADPVVFFGFPFLDPVHRQGAGMLDIDDAIAATTRVEPSELSLGEGTSAHERTIRITNEGPDAVTYTLAHQPALGTGGSTFAPSLFANFAAVAFSANSVTLAPGESGVVGVSVMPLAPAALLRSVYGGYIHITGAGGVYRVPYAGFTGDYQSIQVLAPAACSFPGVFRRGGQTMCSATSVLPGFTRQGDAAVFNVEDRNDRPVILYHRAHQARRLEIRAVEVATGATHLVASGDYVSRNASNGLSLASGGFSTYTWDGKKVFTNPAGQMRRNALPSGPYQLQVVVTKALAEPGNPAHVETWTSPTIIITR